jgi:F-type H+-transporting ATPase subunit delta
MTSLDAKRAARALFQATQAQGTARATLDGLQAFRALLQESTELRDLITSVFVPVSVKTNVIEQVTAALGTPAAAKKALLILVQMHQPAGMAGLTNEFKTLVHRHERLVDAEVTTAVPLDEAQLARVRDALSQATGQEVSLTARVDSAVIGGAVTRVGSVVYDGSLARQLARLKEQLVQQG